MELPRTAEVVRLGAEEGLHVGAQLSVHLPDGGEAGLVSGLAGQGRPMTQRTLMPWLSATKVVTAVAVLQQWERQRVDLDAPVAAYVPEFAASGKAEVTVRHLLTHTAGLAASAGGQEGAEALLATACASPLLRGWVPGRRAAYSPRLGFHVLGEVVRRIDGRTFDSYVTEELFEPLGMADSWLALSPQRRAAYGGRIGEMHDTTSGQARVAASPGGAAGEALPSSSGVGPAGDLLRVFVMLLGRGRLDGARILSPQGVEAMCARHRTGLRDETFGAVVDWGLGVMVNSWHYLRRPAPYGYGDHASPRAFGHGGSQSSVAFADPEAGLAAVIVFNGMAGEAAHHRRTQPVINALYEDVGLDR